MKHITNQIKIIRMALKSQTELGLTFGQILSVIGIVSLMLTAWININVRISTAEVRVDQLEKGRVQNAISIETMRIENKKDFKDLSDKLDKLIIMNKGE